MSYKEKICGIYMIKNIANNKTYIGQSVHILQRFNTHKHNLRTNCHSNIHLQRAWNKYGEENFEFSILKQCNKDDLDNLEIDYIATYDSYKNGYNRDLGGKTEGHKSPETMIKLKESKSFISDKTREKMRKSQKTIPIFQIDLKGNVVNEWSGAREASNVLDIKQSCIWNCVNKNRKTYKNFIWIDKREFDTFQISDYISKTNPKPKKVVQLDLDNNLIKIWDGIRIVSKELSFRADNIIACCKNRIDSYKQFKWMYKEDYEKLIS